jgi:hypothetical protein
MYADLSGGMRLTCTDRGRECMKARKSWATANEAFYQYVVNANKRKEFVRL